MNSFSDEIFLDQYEKIRRIFSMLWFVSLPMRIFVGTFTSFEKVFGHNQLQVVISYSAMVFGLNYYQNSSITKKRICLFFFMQYCLLALRYMSLYVEPRAELLYCMLDTTMMLLYETCIWSKSYWVPFVMAKNILIWCFFDTRNATLFQNFGEITSPTIVAIFSTMCFSSFFEHQKLKIFELNVESKRIIKAAHDQLFDILKVFPDGLIVMNMNEEVKFKNNTFAEIFKKNKNSMELLGSIQSLHSSETLLNEIKSFINKQEGTESSLGIVEINSKQYECRAHKIKWNEEPCCMLTVKDVSSILGLERIKAENNAKNLIIRSISHEFRTPINCIYLVIEEIFPKVQKEIQEKLDIVKTSAELLIFQINDILDYSDLTLGKFTLSKSEVNLKEELNSWTSLITIQAKYKNVEVKTSIDESIPETISTDCYRLKKVVINLLTNALKYTFSGSIDLYARVTDDSLLVGVKDTGTGISIERQQQLLNMFTDYSSSGLSCLGLHVCQKILEHLGSGLIIESVPGEGSNFSFKLDISNCSASSSMESIPSETVSESRYIPKSSDYSPNFEHTLDLRVEYPKLLIVDDNEFNRMCISNVLKNHGIQFVEAKNGDEAVEKVMISDKMSRPLKCIIMDLNMPVMDGWEASQMIVDMHSQGKILSMPVIVGHSAYCSMEDLNRCYQSGMVDYMIKPTPQEQMLKLILKYT